MRLTRLSALSPTEALPSDHARLSEHEARYRTELRMAAHELCTVSRNAQHLLQTEPAEASAHQRAAQGCALSVAEAYGYRDAAVLITAVAVEVSAAGRVLGSVWVREKGLWDLTAPVRRAPFGPELFRHLHPAG